MIDKRAIHKELDEVLEIAGRPGWWGEVGVSVLVQDGKFQVIRQKEKTSKEKRMIQS
jgi:hypothetical protein